MKEIRFHGRGGQGTVTAAEVLAIAAFFDGKYSQAFPAFGVERRGAPVMAFARIDDKPIRRRSQVYAPDYVIVQDATLISSNNVSQGLKKSGVLITNSSKKPEELFSNIEAKVYTVDATKIAIEFLGKPIVNMPMLGAFAGITEEVSIESLKKAVSERFSGAVCEKNIAAVEAVAKKVLGKTVKA